MSISLLLTLIASALAAPAAPEIGCIGSASKQEQAQLGVTCNNEPERLSRKQAKKLGVKKGTFAVAVDAEARLYVCNGTSDEVVLPAENAQLVIALEAWDEGTREWIHLAGGTDAAAVPSQVTLEKNQFWSIPFTLPAGESMARLRFVLHTGTRKIASNEFRARLDASLLLPALASADFVEIRPYE